MYFLIFQTSGCPYYIYILQIQEVIFDNYLDKELLANGANSKAWHSFREFVKEHGRIPDMQGSNILFLFI